MEKKQNWAKAKKNDGPRGKKTAKGPQKNKFAHSPAGKKDDTWAKKVKPLYDQKDKKENAASPADEKKGAWQKREKPAYSPADKRSDARSKKENAASPADEKKGAWQKREKPAYSPKDKQSDFWPKKEKNSYVPKEKKNDTWPPGKESAGYTPKEGQGEALNPAERDDSEIVAGKNSVLEALQSELTVNKIWLCLGSDTAFTDQLLALCRKKSIPWQIVGKEAMERIAGAHHQGVAAACTPFRYTELADILAQAKGSGQPPFLLLLAGVEDPHNFGSIIRTAECVGVHGLIIPKRRSASVNQTVLRVSAGAAAYMPIARVNNLPQTVDFLKQQGVWVIGAHMTGAVPMWDANLTGPLCLIVGGEGQGMPELLQKKCDRLVAIPQWGKISSLNVANAAAVLLYEIARQKQASL